MSRFQHTPGPWIARNSNGAPTVWTADKVYKVAACTVVGTGGEAILKKEQRYGNADLIAAAPDLLAVVAGILDGTLYCTCGSDISCPLCIPAEAAMAKAMGRETKP